MNNVHCCMSAVDTEGVRTLENLCDCDAKQTILMVEDEPFLRGAIAETVKSAGYNVFLASNAPEALQILNETEAIDLLLADVVMPRISGLELARRLRVLSPRTEVVLMSGYEEEAIRCEQCLEGIRYLAKPFSIGTLLQRLREQLSKRPCHQQLLF